QHCWRDFHRKGASVIDISGTQFMRPTPMAPISIEPTRTAWAVSRSLPICALGKICTVILPPDSCSMTFLNCSAQMCQPCAVGAGCAKRIFLGVACARASGALAATMPAPRRCSARRRSTVGLVMNFSWRLSVLEIEEVRQDGRDRGEQHDQ